MTRKSSGSSRFNHMTKGVTYYQTGDIPFFYHDESSVYSLFTLKGRFVIFNENNREIVQTEEDWKPQSYQQYADDIILIALHQNIL